MTTHITKTWFDGKTVVTVTKEIPVGEFYNQEIAADPKAFHGFPNGSVSTSNAGGKCVTAGETAPTHFMNSTKTVAVSNDVYWLPIDADTPRSAKLQLLSIGGVAQYGVLGSDPTFFTHWCPLPKKAKP